MDKRWLQYNYLLRGGRPEANGTSGVAEAYSYNQYGYLKKKAGYHIFVTDPASKKKIILKHFEF